MSIDSLHNPIACMHSHDRQPFCIHQQFDMHGPTLMLGGEGRLTVNFVLQTCLLHFGLNFIMELTHH
jgi:hypothetical protein